VTDESLVNEVNFCYVSPTLEADIEEASSSVVDNGVLIRGANNSVINRLGSKFNFEFEEN
jgi:hypothetical protein